MQAQGVNSCPITQSKPLEDPSGPNTPLHLQLGRASIEVPKVKFYLNTSLTKSLRYLYEIKKDFWKKWMAQVFQGQVLAKKWRRRHHDAQVSDVVLIKNKTGTGIEFQRGRVIEDIPGEDGHIVSK